MNRAAARTHPTLIAVQVTAVLALLGVLWQGFTAAGVISDAAGALDTHGTGSVVLHVLTGLLAAAAVAHRVLSSGPTWAAVLAVVVFVATFVEGLLGSAATLAGHIPLALLITGGITVITVWAARTGQPG